LQPRGVPNSRRNVVGVMLEILAIMLLSILALIVFVSIHESGHVLMARAFGDQTASFALIDFKGPKPVVALTRTAPFDQFTNLQNAWIFLGGPLGTRAVAELVWFAKPVIPFFDQTRAFWFVLFGLLRSDFLLYSFRNILGTYVLKSPQHDQDISGAVKYLEQASRVPKAFLFATFFGIAVLDVIFSANRILFFYS
jgi:membrane-associated protease RseP (regulator of RpoE activity)